MRILAWTYCLFGLGACLLVPLNAVGWAGEPDPLSGVYALIFALPWSFLLKVVPEPSPWLSLAGCVAGIAINTVILLWIAKRLVNRRSRDA